MKQKSRLRLLVCCNVKALLIFLLVLFVASCAKEPGNQTGDEFGSGLLLSSNLINISEWQADLNKLSLKGQAPSGVSTVSIFQGNSTDRLLAKVFVKSDLSWNFRKQIGDLTQVPCSVYVVAGNRYQTATVNSAPVNCIKSKNGSQNPVATTNSPPNGVISVPSSDISLTKGDTFTFKGSATDPDGDNNLVLSWDFGGYVPNQQGSSAKVKFDRVGSVKIKLRVKDSNNAWDPTPATLIVAVNEPAAPVPNGVIVLPSKNITIQEGDMVTFNAIGTGAGELSYLWSFGGAAPDVKQKKTGNITFSKAGVYVVKLIVSDSLGVVDPSPDSIIVTVQPAAKNLAPTAKIISPTTTQNIMVGDAVVFSGSGEDPEGGALQYRWDFATSGIAESRLKSPGSKTFSRAGTFVVTLTVTDNKGLSSKLPASVTINVSENVATGKTPPDGIIVLPDADLTLNVGDSFTFKASAVDPDGITGMKYYWDFDGYAANASGKTATITFGKPANIVVKLRVKDITGLWDPTVASVNVKVTAKQPNSAPESVITAPASHQTVSVGDSIYFSGKGVDQESNQGLTYLWDFDGAAPDSTQQIPGSITFDRAGFYAVRFVVTDSAGLTDVTPAVKFINVTDVGTNVSSPQAVIEFPVADVNITVGEAVRFAAQSQSASGPSSLRYLWNFDGVIPNSLVQNPGSVVFNKAGVYRITLDVTNAQGVKSNKPDVRIVTVTDNNTQSIPDSKILSPAADMIIEVGDMVDFSGSGSGSNLSYFWNFDGVALNSNLKNPGKITFTNAGIFNISLRVTDDKGVQDPTPDTVQIIVKNTLAVNEPPNGLIVNPAMDLVINENDSIEFVGLGLDSNGDALTYFWDFAGAVPNSNDQSPGLVTFTAPGSYLIKLLVTDETGLSDPTVATRTIVVRPRSAGLLAPNASILMPASNLVVTEGDVINFTGLVSDPDNGAPYKYFWNFDGAMPNSVLLNPGNVKFAKAGTYRVQFNVTDVDGLSDPTPAERIITVRLNNSATGENIAPNGVIVSPAKDQTIVVGSSLNFSALASDVDGNTPISFRWNMDGVVPNISAQNPGLVTFDRVGTYRIVLVVTDSLGLSDLTPVERIITVTSGATSNQPPDATIISPAGNKTISVDESLYFSGEGTDPENNQPLKFYWDFAGVQPNKLGANAGDVIFNKAGTYDIYLKVVDSLGLSDPTPAKVTITVKDVLPAVNLPPDGKIDTPSSSRTIQVGQTLMFAASGTDPENGVVSYAWDFDNSGIAVSTLKVPGVKTFNKAGKYTISMTVTDDKGLSDPSPATIIVTVVASEVINGNSKPNGEIVSPASSAITLNRGDSFTFKAVATDPDGDADLLLRWNFNGYAPNQTGANATVKFSTPGVVTVRLDVRDSDNQWDPTPAEITVTIN